MRRASSMATAYRLYYESAGEAVEADTDDDESAFGGNLTVSVGGGQSTTAYLIAVGEGQSSALLDINDSTVVISGNFTKSSFAVLASQLEQL